MRISFLLGSLLWVSASLAVPYGATCDCSGTRNGGSTAAPYVCRDSRLGPKVLPRKLPLGTLIADYDRFEGLTPGQFLKAWTDAKGDYLYPPQNGFQLDQNGNAINGTMILQTGTYVDRFGSEYGSFISAAAAPYSQRALPPSNLDTNPSSPDFPYNYHVYQEVHPFNQEAFNEANAEENEGEIKGIGQEIHWCNCDRAYQKKTGGVWFGMLKVGGWVKVLQGNSVYFVRGVNGKVKTDSQPCD
ncbi:hypothetical protein AK830_g7888 [Neonectria ditissima]|uniref:TNT domain-containing protein n=1 Tax=Neonectria ditissima TaxID=78410 RepID=A0A0P7BDU9_9HYPO|nr:hypothetical protein AK830_g7888 [Neonectria ditissima]